MRRKIFCVLLSLIVLITGCFSYSDINRVLFVTSVVVDIDQDNMVVLYLESFLPTKGASNASAKGQRLTFKGRGKTVYEVMKDINLSSSYKLNYTQNRVIIFTKKAAEYGLDNFIDTFERQQELLIRPYVAVLIGNPEKFMSMQLKEEEFIGLFLKNLIDNQESSSRTVQVRLNEFLDRRTMGSKTSIVTTIDTSQDQLEPKIQVDGGTIIKKDKYAGDLKKQDGEKYNFLMNRVKEGTLEPDNPNYNNKFITLNISDSKTTTSLNFDGKKIHLKKKIYTKVSIADIQKGINLNKDVLDKIKVSTEDNIKKFCLDFFNEYKKKQLDIFDIQEEFYRKYPKEKVKNIMEITDLELQVNVSIDDTLDIFDFR